MQQKDGVGQAADFTATAVVDQEFKTIKLSDHRGKYVLLSTRLYLCLSD